MPPLILFDFDQTLIPEDSDRLVFSVLGVPQFARDAVSRARAGEGWTGLMDEYLGRAQRELNLNAEEVLGRLKTAEFRAEMRDVLKELSGHHAEMHVLSDANTAYISAILGYHGLENCFGGIVTNPARVEDGVLRIDKYRRNAVAAKRHERCVLGCPENLCKGEVTQLLLAGHHGAHPDEHPQLRSAQRTVERAIYVGDGSNDYCPATRLLPTDLVLARRGFALEKRILAEGVKARVAVWEDWEELASLLRDEVFGTKASI